MVRNWKNSKRTGDWLLLANGLVLLVLINMLASQFFFRIDLTEEKRYTIQSSTKKLLKGLDDDVYVEVFLEGNLNPGFKRFQKSIRETLEEFRVYSDDKIHYTFTDPSVAISEKAKNEFMSNLASRGITPKRIIDGNGNDRSEQIVFPGAIITYGGAEEGITLLKDNIDVGAQQKLNQSVEGVEFELANTIQKLTRETRKKIGFIHGHGELDSLAVAELNRTVAQQYDVIQIELPEVTAIPVCDAIVIAKPTTSFSEGDKFKLDQFIVHGGKAIFLIDQFDASMDSASRENYYAFPYDLKLTDLLFRYGIRINEDIVQDLSSGKYPVIIGMVEKKPDIRLMQWPFFPLITHYASHPITRNLDATEAKFISSLDTVKAIGIKKTLLFSSSLYSRKLGAPVKVGVQDFRKQFKRESYVDGEIPLAYLLEGKFSSLYKNRFLPAGVDSTSFSKESRSSKVIVVADGDLVRNDVNPRTGEPQPLGLDPFDKYTYANGNLIMNMIAFITDENGLINARNKEVKIRPLDKEKTKIEKTYWQILNIGLPLLLLVAFGIARSWLRKRKYAHFG